MVLQPSFQAAEVEPAPSFLGHAHIWQVQPVANWQKFEDKEPGSEIHQDTSDKCFVGLRAFWGPSKAYDADSHIPVGLQYHGNDKLLQQYDASMLCSGSKHLLVARCLVAGLYYRQQSNTSYNQQNTAFKSKWIFL